MLRSILHNLVGNAIKYTETGSVTVTCRVLGSAMTIVVRDTGIGIPSDKLEAIFLEYERVYPETGDGLGLGLAIVGRQVELLGHRINVESQVGVGSCFRLELPHVAHPPNISAQEPIVVDLADGVGANTHARHSRTDVAPLRQPVAVAGQPYGKADDMTETDAE
jgi:hypothetical protein